MKHLPNLLSAARILLAPYIFYLLSTGQFGLALLWFAAAGLTDGLDGYLARRWDAGSRLGALLDPVSDKLLLSGSVVVLAMGGAVPVWLAVLILGRDLGILLAAVGVLLFSTRPREFPPSVWGKISTLVQVGYVLAVVAAAAEISPIGPALVLQWLAVLFTAWSGIHYTLLFWRTASAPAPGE